MDIKALLIDGLDIFLRSISSVAVLFIISKLMGKKQISQLSFFDYIVGITIGSIAAQMAFDDSLHYYETIIAIATYGLCDIAIAVSTIKSVKLRRFFIGTPTVLIYNGKIIEENLISTRYDINELLSESRYNGYFNLCDIKYAIFETTGRVSFLPYSDKKPVTPYDMNLNVEQENLVANVIIDGNIMYNNLHSCGKDENWLKNELKIQKYNNIKDIILATCDNNTLTVYKKTHNKKKLDIFE